LTGQIFLFFEKEVTETPTSFMTENYSTTKGNPTSLEESKENSG
jgi:hypothetical protein